jgi:predicted cupin superfamily sugar epimerase
MPLSGQEVIGLLGLEPLPGEGGFFRETYRAAEQIPRIALPPRYSGDHGRAHSTQIYFLLTAETPSLMHVVESDEVFHHYLGDPVEQLQISAGGEARVVRIGPDLAAGERPQVLVRRGVWQGCRIEPERASAGFALLGCTVSPGFDWADFRLGDRRSMLALCAAPDTRLRALITQLTPG